MIEKWISNNKKGITAMMLVVLIIILLILAGILIAIFSDGGLTDRAAEARRKYIRAKEIESIRLAWSACEVELQLNKTPIDIDTFTEAMHDRNEKTKIVKATLDEVRKDDIAVDVEYRTGYASVTFTETNNEYFVALVEYIGEIYEITYDDNGGTGGPEKQNKYEGVTLILSTKQPTRDYYYFAYWNTEQDGTGDIYYPGGYYNWDEEATLYAIWAPTPYSITYDLDGGVFTLSNPTQYTILSEEFTINNPRKDNMAFLGWTGTGLDEMTRKVTIPTGSTGSRVYQAHWTDPVYRVDGISEYLTLKDALDAAHDGSLIEMLKDSIESPDEDLVNTKNVRFDLAGHTLEIDKTIINDGSLTIVNTTDGNSRIVNEERTCIINRGILQLGDDDGTVKENIVIEGKTGIVNDGEFNFYDGQIVGEKGVRGVIDNTPVDYKAISSRVNQKELVRLNMLTESQARINNVYYSTVEQAIEAVDEDETVVLLVGLSKTNSIEVPEGKKFKFDLNGFTISTSISDYVIKNYGSMEIIDNSPEKSSSLEGINYGVIYNGTNADLIINGSNIKSTKSGTNAIYNYNGSVEVLTGNIVGASSGIYNLAGTIDIKGGNITGSSRTIYNADIENLATEAEENVVDISSIIDFNNIINNGAPYVTSTNISSNETEGVLGELINNGEPYTADVEILGEEISNVKGPLTDNGTIYTKNNYSENEVNNVIDDLVYTKKWYFSRQSDGTYIPTNGKTYQLAHGGTAGVPSTTANSYATIDLRNMDGKYAVVVNARISSQRSYDYGYATITSTSSSPSYNATSGRFMYIAGTEANKNYYSSVLTGGSIYYLHLGYYKNGSTDTNEDQLVINSIKLIEADSYNYSYKFEEQDNGTIIPTNGKTYQLLHDGTAGIPNVTANSYVKIDLRGLEGEYSAVVNARISSEENNDFGYATITSSTDRVSYSSETGRFMYISGNKDSADYKSSTMTGGSIYYLHLGYYKNSSVDTGEDQLAINSIKIYKARNIIENYEFVQENGVLVPTNGKTYQENHGGTEGKQSSRAYSCMKIDLTNYTGKYVIRVNARISSQSSGDYGYAHILDNTDRRAIYSGNGRFMAISGTVADKDYTSSNLLGGNIYYLHLEYYKNATIDTGEDQLVINSIKLLEVTEETTEYGFKNYNGALIPENSKTYQVANGGTKGIQNTNANSCYKIDLTSIPEDKAVKIIVNAESSSRKDYDMGYVTVNQTIDAPAYNTTTGRFVYISGTIEATDYTSQLLYGGNVYYLHFGYRKSSYSDVGNDYIKINSIQIKEYNLSSMEASISMTGGYVLCNSSGTGIYNASIKPIEISGGTIKTTSSSNGYGIYNEKNGNIDLTGDVVIDVYNKSSGNSTGLYNGGSGIITINENVSITTGCEWNSHLSKCIINAGKGTIIVNGGILTSNSKGGSNGGNAGNYGGIDGAGIDNLSSGSVIVNSGTIKAISLTYGSTKIAGVANSGNGTVEIYGGTIFGSINTTSTCSNSSAAGVANYDIGTVFVRGGDISSSIPNTNASYSSTSYSLGILNKGSGTVYIDGDANITVTDNTKVNNAGIGNIGIGTTVVSSGNIECGTNSIFADKGLIEAKNISLNGTVYNKGGLIKINNDSEILQEIIGGSNSGIGIMNEKGTIELGSKASTSLENISIIGSNYGILNTGEFGYYSGTITGQNAINGSVTELKVDTQIKIEDNNNNTETASIVVLEDDIAEIVETGEKYKSLQNAILACNGNSSTIRIIKDNVYILKYYGEDDGVSIDSNQNIKLDLNGNTIISGQQINNDGILEITNSQPSTGKITSSKIIHNMGSLIINEGAKVESINKNSSVIENESTGIVSISGIVTSANDHMKMIYNKSGTVEILDAGNIIVPNSYSYGVYNDGIGSVVMSGGTISYASRTTSYKYGLYNNGEGIIEINGGENLVQGSSTFGAYNNGSGKIIFNDGTITVDGNGWSSPYYMCGIYNAGSGLVQMTGGTINSNYYGMCNLTDGKILMTGGDINITTRYTGNSGYDGIYNIANGTLEIKSGNINATKYGINSGGAGTIIIGEKGNNVNTSIPVIRGYTYGIFDASTNQYSTADKIGKVYFYDGIIKGITDYYILNFVEFEDEYQINETQEVIGGKTYKCATLQSADNVAVIAETGEEFKSLDKAINKCMELGSNPYTIQIIKDCNLYNTVIIEENRNLCIDLQGHTVTFNISDSVTDDSDIINNGNLTIKNGTLYTILSYANSPNRKLIRNTGELELGDGLTLSNKKSQYSYGIYNDVSGNVNIKQCQITLNTYLTQTPYQTYVIYNHSTGHVDLNGGTIRGTFSISGSSSTTYFYSIYNSLSGTININSGDVNASSNSIYNVSSGLINVSGGTITGTITNTSGGTIQITGGSVSGSYGVNNTGTGSVIIGSLEHDLNQDAPVIRGTTYGIFNEKGKVYFYDGTIKGLLNYTSQGFEAIRDGSEINEFDETIGEKIYRSANLVYVQENVAIIEETNEEFKVLNDAFDRCMQLDNNSYTIRLLRDCYIRDYITINNGKTIHLNLDTHKMNSNVDDIYLIRNNGTLRIENGTIRNLVSGNSNEYRSIIQNRGTLEIGNDAIIDNYGNYIKVIENVNDGVLNINGGIVKSNNQSHSSFNTYGVYNAGIGTVTIDGGNVEINPVYSTQARTTSYSVSPNAYAIYNNDGNINVVSGNISISMDSDRTIIATGYYYGIYNAGNGSINISGGNINVYYVYTYYRNPSQSYAVPGAYAYGIYNATGNGIINISEGTISTTMTRTASSNGSINLNGYTVYNSGSVNVSGGNILGSHCAIYNLKNVTATGGKISGSTYGIHNNNSAAVAIIGDKNKPNNKTNPEIVGNKYGIYNQNGSVDFYSGVVKGKTRSIDGQIRTVRPSYVIKVGNVDSYNISVLTPESQANAIALVNGTYYSDLQSAINACTDTTKTYYITLVNGSFEGNVVINENQSIILDLNGFIINSNQDYAIINNGKLQIVDTSIKTEETSYGSINNRAGVAIQNNGPVLTIGDDEESLELNTEMPIINGTTYGIENTNNSATICFCDGIIKGGTNAVTGINNLITPDGYTTATTIVDEKEIMTLVPN